MKRLREYLKERNIPENSLESNSILEGYEKGYKDAIDKVCKRLFENVYDHLNPEDQERVESFRKYMEE